MKQSKIAIHDFGDNQIADAVEPRANFETHATGATLQLSETNRIAGNAKRASVDIRRKPRIAKAGSKDF